MMIGAEGASSSKKARISGSRSSENMHFFALVVDDDPMIRKIHSMILKSVGFKVELAENGKQAVDFFRTGAKFHFVFIDMEMPIMNGIEATKQMRAMKVESKIVGVTSRNSETEREVFMQAGLDLCYTKPLTMAKVVPLLEELQKN